ncbi:MAG: adenosylcobinamide-phosphate synthase CbiB [Eubacterium sp.]|nr:adenosylcobinamide-phosphate synthase CbiB [Eubacterium sp.]
MLPEWLKYHIIALGIGVLLDLLVGDPEWLPHPIRWMGSLIADLEEKWNKSALSAEERRRRGKRMVSTVLILTVMYSGAAVFPAYYIHPWIGVAVEAVLSAYMLAARSLAKESSNVAKALETEGLEAGRMAVARIVGRETARLDKPGVIRAAVETVAENASDGVIAPFFYLLIGGPVLGCAYKAVNTMDSMVGYKSERYIDFGRAAARLDDVLNYIPARLTGGLLTLAAVFLPGCSAGDSVRIRRRDAKKSTSLNSGVPEATVAGALGVELLGDAYYHGELVHKPKIGDLRREICTEDIGRTNRMMFLAEGLLIILVGLLTVIAVIAIGAVVS